MKKSTLALIVTIIIVIAAFQPILWAIVDPQAEYSFGDFKTVLGEKSANIRKEMVLETFSYGKENKDNNRFFLIGGLTFFSDYFDFSDTQFHAFLIIIFIILGSYGIYRLAGLLELDDSKNFIMILVLIPFYFLNFWSVDRIIHIWIWFTYAIFPLFLSFGLTFFNKRKDAVTYSLCLGLFGFIPHSFIYLFGLHLILTAYHFLLNKRIVLFFFIPLIIFIFLNLPTIILGMITETVYPISVSSGDLHMLSRNGELINAFAFSNNWWPQVNDEAIYDNLVFRVSSVLIFAIAFLEFTNSATKKDQKKFWLYVLSFLSILLLLFVAQGTNNSIVSYFVKIVSDNGKDGLFSLFREWARVSILIPIFLVIIFLLSKKNNLLVLVLVLNVLSSPGWHYINENYSAVKTPDQYYQLKEEITGEFKTIDTGPKELGQILGNHRNVWDESKISQWLHGIGQGYDRSDIGELQKIGDLPKELLDSLNIKYVIKRNDLYQGKGYQNDYTWLSCKKIENLTICKNDIAEQPFEVYQEIIDVGDNQSQFLSYAYIDTMSLAPSKMLDPDFVLNKNEKKPIWIIEPELINNSNSIEEKNASGGKIATFNTSIEKEFNTKKGTYTMIARTCEDIIIELNNEKFEFDSEKFQIVKRTVNLSEGRQKLEISGKGKLDVVWLINSDLPIYKNAKITDFKRLSPSKWTVNATSTGPFILGFAETYSKNFEAKIFKDEKLISIVKPVEIFKFKNGFKINDTGNLSIEISYAPQDFFNYSLSITWITLLVCIILWVKQ